MKYCKKDLLNCRTLTEANAILETLRPSESARKLVETAIPLMASTDGRQRSIALDFMHTAIREIDDDNDVKPKNGSVEPPTSEAVETSNTQSGGSTNNQSTSTTGLQKEGTEEPVEAGAIATENQMKEGFGQPGMPQQMPGQMDPALQQAMVPPGAIPQMNNEQMMQQMRYTVQESLRPIVSEIRALKEGLVALDGKVQETVQSNTIALDIPIKSNAIPVRIQETEPGVKSSPAEKSRFNKQEIALSMERLNDELSRPGVQ